PAPSAPFPVISPSSLDGRNSALDDAGALDFAHQAVCRKSEPQRATVTNKGGRPLVIGKIDLASEEFDFKSDCENRTLKTDESCHIDVTLTPSRSSQINAGVTVNIHDNVAGGEQTIALNGTTSPRL